MVGRNVLWVAGSLAWLAGVSLAIPAQAATMKDPAYLADARKKRLRVVPTGAGEPTRIVSDTIDAPDNVIDKAKFAVARKGLIECTEFTQAKYCRKARKKKKSK